MGSNVFVYGTLLAPEILQALLNRIPSNKPATLTGFIRRGLKKRTYPAMEYGKPTDKVDGLVMYDLTQDEVAIFDEYEDIFAEKPEYSKIEVPVHLEDGTSVVVDAYIWQGDDRQLHGSWDYENFRKKYLHDFMVNCGWLVADE